MPTTARKLLMNLVKNNISPKYFNFLKAKYLNLTSKRKEENIKKSKVVEIGGIRLIAPSNHLVHYIHLTQPFRDDCLGIIVKVMGNQYPYKRVLDIGANIGDSCAYIRKYSKVPIYCVEPHELFYSYLIKNVSNLGNIENIYQVFIDDGSIYNGSLVNTSESTARFVENHYGKQISTYKIADLKVKDIGLVKIDTDGFDFSIILNNLDFLCKEKPLVFFENEIRQEDHLIKSNRVIDSLYEANYKYWLVFDDRGYLLLGTQDKNDIYHLNKYLLQTWLHDKDKRIYNYDILAVPESDYNIFLELRNFYLQNG